MRLRRKKKVSLGCIVVSWLFCFKQIDCNSVWCHYWRVNAESEVVKWWVFVGSDQRLLVQSSERLPAGTFILSGHKPKRKCECSSITLSLTMCRPAEIIISGLPVKVFLAFPPSLERPFILDETTLCLTCEVWTENCSSTRDQSTVFSVV